MTHSTIAQVEQTEMFPAEKPFNMYWAVGKVAIAGIALFATLFTAKAMFSDFVLDNLETNYASAITIHDRLVTNLRQAQENERMSADAACNSFKALKSYKELKKLSLKNEFNPCVRFKAPQENFPQAAR